MLPNKDVNHPENYSHLFTLRMWLEDLDSEQLDWRGKVQHVDSGEVIYFRKWQTMEAFIEGLLSKPKSVGIRAEEDN